MLDIKEKHYYLIIIKKNSHKYEILRKTFITKQSGNKTNIFSHTNITSFPAQKFKFHFLNGLRSLLEALFRSILFHFAKFIRRLK